MPIEFKKPAATVIVTVLLALFAAFLTPRLVQVQKLRQRSEALERDLKDLKKQNELLERELRLLRDDPVYIEKVARAQFNKAKEGEIVYKVVREDKNTKPA